MPASGFWSSSRTTAKRDARRAAASAPKTPSSFRSTRRRRSPVPKSGRSAGLKIDLSKLFGAPSALEQAVLERDTELVADGRDAVGMAVGIPKRRVQSPQTRDDLDDLMDGLDKLDL